jgi:hypothetical protein
MEEISAMASAQETSVIREDMPIEMAAILKALKNNKSQTLEIELMSDLPDLHASESSLVVVDTPYVGILGKALVKAFVQAKHSFNKNRHNTESIVRNPKL